MAINDFITSTLNLGIDQIDSLDIVRKGYTHHTNNHLKMGGRKMGHNLLILVPFDFCAN